MEIQDGAVPVGPFGERQGNQVRCLVCHDFKKKKFSEKKLYYHQLCDPEGRQALCLASTEYIRKKIRDSRKKKRQQQLRILLFRMAHRYQQQLRILLFRMAHRDRECCTPNQLFLYMMVYYSLSLYTMVYYSIGSVLVCSIGRHCDCGV